MVCHNLLQLNVCLPSEERYSLHSLITCLSSRHFEIVMLYTHLKGETAVQTEKMAATCLTNNDVMLSIVMQLSIVSTIGLSLDIPF